MNRIGYRKNSWPAAVVALMVFAGCRDPYVPPKINQTTNYLVVEGAVFSGDSSVITLSRTRTLGDSTPAIPEFNATVALLGSAGDTYNFSPGPGGTYSITGLNLPTAETYQLEVATSDGLQYVSDPVPVVQTPPIDSVSWVQQTNVPQNKQGVYVYVNTHDPNNATHYYRWEFEETYQYDSKFESTALYEGNGLVVGRTPDQQVYHCWRTFASTQLNIASTVRLSQDVVSLFPLVFIPQGDQKLGVRYSINVRQYAITEQAYNYWLTLKKNTELTGSLFDPQPSQGTGNFHCTNNPKIPVLGNFSIATAQSQRIFISSNQLSGWGFVTYPAQGCVLINSPPDSFAYYFGSAGYIPTSQSGLVNYNGSFPLCADCTVQGGATLKPSFW